MTDSTTETTIGTAALKERAGVINALVNGVQTVLVRSPDLAPCGYDGRFALYPGYSHQDPDRYSPRHERYYHVSTTKSDAGIPIRATARVVEEYTVEPDNLGSLTLHYVYSADGLRDKYGLEDSPGSVLLVRVAKLETSRRSIWGPLHLSLVTRRSPSGPLPSAKRSPQTDRVDRQKAKRRGQKPTAS